MSATPSVRGSVRAVAAGFFLTAVLSLGTDAILHATGLYPAWGQPMSQGLFALAMLYRVGYTILGGYAAVRLAPGRTLRHAWVLALIGTAFSLLGVLASIKGGPEMGPRWYPIALVLTAVPSVLIGGRLAAVWPAELASRETNGKRNDFA